MPKIRNKSTIPQGMLAPNGLYNTPVDPFVQSTTRPPGTLLESSPGYDSIRMGKNLFQRGVPTGGFRPQTFAEEIGGQGSALSVIPGSTSVDEASEWLPENEDSLPEGSVIIADRSMPNDFASELHGGYNTIPDMGDRHPSRPLSRQAANWLYHPVQSFKTSFGESPITAVIGGVGFVVLLSILAHDAEREFNKRRGNTLTGAVETPPAVSADVTDRGVNAVATTTTKGVDAIEKATNEAISAISEAGKDVVKSIESATT